MNIFVNGEMTQVADNATLTDLSHKLNLPERGVAIAVNRAIVQKEQWSDKQLNENDTITIIKAACGG